MSGAWALILNIGCVWIVLSVLIAARASAFGRSFVKFLLLGLVLSPVVAVAWLLTVGVNPATMTLCPAHHLMKKGEGEECEVCATEITEIEEEPATARIKVKREKKGTSLCHACGGRYTIGDDRCEWCGFPTQRDVDWHLIPPA